jgi:hypothetical protein
VQGSYRNNTNVRHDSDVDVSVICTSVVFTDFTFAGGLTDEDLGFSDSDYTYSQFKSEVHHALVSQFGAAAVSRGNKAFDVNENTYRVAADVVPCFEHRLYLPNRTYYSGTELRPDNGGRIINWPEQNYANGVTKNNATSRRFKIIVRVMKRLRNYMEEQGVREAVPIPGYLIECLCWNVPNEGYGPSTLTSNMRYCLAHLYNSLRADQTCSDWRETNDIKLLFHPSQRWSRPPAFLFISAAWNYLGFE